MPGSLIPGVDDLMRILPEIVLTIVGTAVMALEPLRKEGDKRLLGVIALLGHFAALWGAAVSNVASGEAFGGMIIVDGFATFFRILVIVVGILTVLCSLEYVDRERPDSGEYYALLLFSIVGQCLMAASNVLIMVFIGLEIPSISSYVLAGYLRDDKRNNESAIKYFLLGSFATAFLLYGVAWIYGVTGTTNLTGIRAALADPDASLPMILVATSVALMFVGFAFKVSAAPFQAWAPDVYQGAPAPVAAFLSAGPKAAAFAVLLRVYLTAFEPVSASWVPVVWMIALATMLVGNFGAIVQTNIKRLLAYSSIAHAGYVLVAVTCASQVGAAAAMFYLAAYAFMNVGAFAVVTHFARQGERYVEISDLDGLARKQPVTAALFTIFLLSLIGIPLTGGFFGKFYIFKAALESNLIWLAILGLLNSAVAAYYYLRVIVVMYFHEPGAGAESLSPASSGLRVAMWSSAVATLLLGIYPTLVLDLAGSWAFLGP
jgi:NADH-quinone oxidoreductase subunit N